MYPVICADSTHNARLEVALNAMQRVFHADEVLASEEGDLSDQGVGVTEYSDFVRH